MITLAFILLLLLALWLMIRLGAVRRVPTDERTAWRQRQRRLRHRSNRRADGRIPAGVERDAGVEREAGGGTGPPAGGGRFGGGGASGDWRDIGSSSNGGGNGDGGD